MISLRITYRVLKNQPQSANKYRHFGDVAMGRGTLVQRKRIGTSTHAVHRSTWWGLARQLKLSRGGLSSIQHKCFLYFRVCSVIAPAQSSHDILIFLCYSSCGSCPWGTSCCLRIVYLTRNNKYVYLQQSRVHSVQSGDVNIQTKRPNYLVHFPWVHHGIILAEERKSRVHSQSRETWTDIVDAECGTPYHSHSKINFR